MKAIAITYTDFSEGGNFSPVESSQRFQCWKPGYQGLRMCHTWTTNRKVGCVFILSVHLDPRIIHFLLPWSTWSQPEIIWKENFLSPSVSHETAAEHGEIGTMSFCVKSMKDCRSSCLKMLRFNSKSGNRMQFQFQT